MTDTATDLDEVREALDPGYLEDAAAEEEAEAETIPVEGNDEMGRMKRLPPEVVVDPRKYSWEELVSFAAAGYDVETSWRFIHLTPEQKGAIEREARKLQKAA